MEYELKYAATPEAVPASIAEDRRITSAASGEWRTIPMATTYYDLPGEPLRAKFFTLRCRQEGSVRRVTLKSRTGILHLRGEWETEAEGLADGLPKLAALGAPSLPDDAAQYTPTCGAEFIRRALILQLDGCTAELALDDGRLFKGDKELFFSELELELKDGDPASMEALAKALAADYNLHEEPLGKFTRAINL